MESVVISLGGEDYSVQYYVVNKIVFVDNIQDLNGIDKTESFDNDVFEEIEEKIQNIENGSK